MESIQVISVEEFWEQYKEVTRQIIQEEIKNVPQKGNKEEILRIEDVARILGKTKQTIYLWMEKGELEGYYINDSLFFLKSDIIKKLKQGKNNSKRKSRKEKNKNQ
jgi:hypothetical protein